MMKHRGLILALGLTALLGLSARESRAANMQLLVIYGGSTFTFTGTQNAVTPSLTVLNGDLAGSGYSFTGIGGSSNNGFATTNAFVADSGTLQVTAGGTGGPLTIIVTETGFTAPASGTGNTMLSTQGATFTNTTTASSQMDVGNFMDNGSVNQSLPTSPSTLFGTTPASQSASATAGLPAYAIPFTLTSTTMINMGAASSSSPGNDVFTSTTSVQATVVPEPASLILTLTGMPLPLVVMGLLRRRRAAA
jgi:hypothetical protein